MKFKLEFIPNPKRFMNLNSKIFCENKELTIIIL